MKNANLAKQIAALRKRAGLTQEQLAASLNITPQAVSKWENGSSKPRVKVLFQLADILGVSVVKSVIPVRPGRNISIVIETAAVVNRQKKMGYFAAKELLKQLGIEE